MEKAEITLKSAGPAGGTRPDRQVRSGKGSLSVHWRNFMLPKPRPADQEADIRAAKTALQESDERIPYEQIRRQLGLE